jgi:UDP-N-acetylbacillosamine N-acetyltransferase
VKPVIIWGASGHARVLAEAFDAGGIYEPVAFVDESDPPPANSLGTKTILRDRAALLQLRDGGVNHIVIGIGDCARRLEIADWSRDHAFTLVTVVHPTAWLSPSSTLGAGSVVLAGAIVSACTSIGENVVLNTAATVDHDCTLADGCHVSPGAHLGGNVRLGRGTWIGIGATVRNAITIGAGTVVGAGAVVVSDLPDHVVAYGVPARIARRAD